MLTTKKSIKKDDLSRFTLPEAENLASTKNLNSEQLFGSLSTYQNSKPKTFWGSANGKIWLVVFGVTILVSVLIPILFFRAT